MKQIAFTASLILLLVLSSTSLSSQSTAMHRLNDSFGNGVNLAGWLEAGWLGASYPYLDTYTFEDFEHFQEIGIEIIRMPVIFEWLADSDPPYSLEEEHVAYALVDSIIAWCQQLELPLIIDNHHGRDLHDGNYLLETARIAGVWKNLALKYGSLNPEQFFFELRNEPTNTISNENLRYVLQHVIDTVRTYAPEHTLIVGANWWNAGWSLIETEPYADQNIIYTYHNYDPFDFTHQGFTWSNNPAGVEFPRNQGEIENIVNAIAAVKAWSEMHDVPVYLGEFGVSTWADANSRCNWINVMGGALDSQSMPWFYWDMKHFYDAFGIFSETLTEPDSLLPCFGEALGLGSLVSETFDPAGKTETVASPNPSRDVFQIHAESPVDQIILTDITGRQSYVLDAESSSVFRWPPNAPPGIYLACIKLNSNWDILRLVRL